MAFKPPKMSESFEYEGFWWLPDDPDNEVPGVVKYDPDEGIELRLLGSFYPTLEEYIAHREHNPDVIHGWLIEPSRPVTLLACMRTGSTIRSPGYRTGKYYGRYFLLGSHSLLDSQFRLMSAEYTNLETWLGAKPFQVSVEHELDDDRKITNIEAVANYVLPKFESVDLDALDAMLKFLATFEQREINPHKLDWMNKTRVSLEANTSQNLEWFISNSVSIERLLALLVGEPVFTELFQLQQVKDDVEDGQSTSFYVYYAAVYSAREESSAWYDMLTTAPFIGMDRVAIAFQDWFRKAEYLRTFANLYLSTRYRKFFPELVLLTLTQALEGYHRQRFEGQYLTDEEYQPFRETLISAIPKSMPSDMQQSLQNRLKYGNEFSLRRRLKDLKNQLSEDLQRCIAKKSFNDFIDYVVKARNQHAHQLTVEQPLESLTGGQLFWANERLGIWITILVFKELGIPDELIVEAIPHNKQYAYLLNKSPDGR